MNIITLDAETYFDEDYTLSKMTTEAYIRDPRFECHGWAVIDDSKGWMDHDEFVDYARTVDWSQTAVLHHHAHFDGLILSHHCGIKPAFFFDTLSMARLLIGNHLSVSLGNLATHFGLEAKNVPYDLFRGKHWADIPGRDKRLVENGAVHDAELTWDIFCQLAQSFPQEEYALVDATVRMFTEPALVGNTALLGEIWAEEAAAKAALLSELGVDGTALRSNDVFANLLRTEGVEPQDKPGKPDKDGNERRIWAFAKTDDFMRECLDSEDDRVALLAEARLSEKSNGVQTRTERLGYMSTRGAMCVYLNYAGTHLAGWSGGDKVNWQNFKRGGPIAKAISAPPGHLIVIADASQIECRLLEMIAGETEGIEEFRRGADPYITLASKFYQETIYKPKSDDPRRAEMEAKRGTGKQLRLSCGYGAGADTIQVTAKKGTYGPPVILTATESLAARDLYRTEKPRVVNLWDEGGDVLKKMHSGLEFDWNVMHIKDRRMYTPRGVPLDYSTLEWHVTDERKGWRLATRRGHQWIWGSKFIENLIQALRNDFIKTAWLTCAQAGMHMVSNEHDKLIAVVREHEAQDAYEFMKTEMSRPPVWLPGIPLDSEGYVSETFAKPEKTP